MKPEDIRNVRKNNPQKTPDDVFNLVENDFPIPEKYQNMNPDDLIEGIIRNDIPVVFLDFGPGMSYPDPTNKYLDFTLYRPGEEPKYCPYAQNDPRWPLFLKRLNNISEYAKREHYPIMIMSLWRTSHALYNVRETYRNSKKKTCAWCGNTTETPVFKSNEKYNRPKAFCCNDCQNKYQNYRYLLRTLVKDGKITTFEQDLRLNPAYSVIEDTQDNSYLLIHELLLECYSHEELDEMQEKENLPLISDKKFIVRDDNVTFEDEDRVCENCGAPISGHRRRRFCSDKCRYEHNNKKKKLGK